MLTYHPAFDSYHCFLRILTFLVNAESDEYEIDSVRILDYYLCVPSGLKTFKFPRDLVKNRKVFSDKVNHYNDVPNQRALFFDLKNIQNSAFVYDLLFSLLHQSAEAIPSSALSYKHNQAGGKMLAISLLHKDLKMEVDLLKLKNIDWLDYHPFSVTKDQLRYYSNHRKLASIAVLHGESYQQLFELVEKKFPELMQCGEFQRLSFD